MIIQGLQGTRWSLRDRVCRRLNAAQDYTRYLGYPSNGFSFSGTRLSHKKVSNAIACEGGNQYCYPASPAIAIRVPRCHGQLPENSSSTGLPLPGTFQPSKSCCLSLHALRLLVFRGVGAKTTSPAKEMMSFLVSCVIPFCQACH